MIAQVQAAIGDNGIGPRGLATAVGLFEAARPNVAVLKSAIPYQSVKEEPAGLSEKCRLAISVQ